MLTNINVIYKYLIIYYCNSKMIKKEEYIKLIKNSNINNYYKKKKLAEKQVLLISNLVKTDIIYRIVNALANRANKYIDKNKYNMTHLELIGCSYEELKVYINNQFKIGMNFDNYGEWELDHIYPISKFNLNNIDEIKKCFNYKNIQPLWMFDNRSKSNKILKNTQTVNEVNRA